MSDGEGIPRRDTPASEPTAPPPASEPTASEPTAPPPASEPTAQPPAGADGGKPFEEMSVGELVFEVSNRASVLVREEIELAKAEVTEKVNSLLRGSVTALAAGVFVLLALTLGLHGIAWLLNDIVFDNFWAGFFIEAAIFLLIAAGAGLYAYRSLKKGAPPTPEMAIEEAKELRQAFDGGEE